MRKLLKLQTESWYSCDKLSFLISVRRVKNEVFSRIQKEFLPSNKPDVYSFRDAFILRSEQKALAAVSQSLQSKIGCTKNIFYLADFFASLEATFVSLFHQLRSFVVFGTNGD